MLEFLFGAVPNEAHRTRKFIRVGDVRPKAIDKYLWAAQTEAEKTSEGKISLKIVAGKDLVNKDFKVFGKGISDPYAIVTSRKPFYQITFW